MDGECFVPRFELLKDGGKGPCVGEGRYLVKFWGAGKKQGRSE